MTATATKTLRAKRIPGSALDDCMPVLAACILRAKETPRGRHSFERWQREREQERHDRGTL